MGDRKQGSVWDPREVSETKKSGDCMSALASVERCVDRSPEGDERWSARLLEALAPLRSAMRQHFAAEERGPLHTEMPINFPHLAGQFDKLRDEHPVLLELVDNVIERASRLQGPEIYELREVDAYVQLLAARLRRHEAAENELMLEAVYNELGGRG